MRHGVEVAIELGRMVTQDASYACLGYLVTVLSDSAYGVFTLASFSVAVCDNGIAGVWEWE